MDVCKVVALDTTSIFAMHGSISSREEAEQLRGATFVAISAARGQWSVVQLLECGDVRLDSA